ncbi:UDP-N-acetylmuramoyl-L-alanine--D-glutamate ligase [Sphaerisporangium sp. NPDC051017]|uniref:UDP-N-acetylmuramoyl-L-alanine--D-glutamate ligase n=1 Tax=Sphaerisporangium sp. NPDC051017 TaxID=3154636 RepID=UPI00342725B0
MLLSHARILVLGLGASGEAATALCASRDWPVTVTDIRDRDDVASALTRLAGLPIFYCLGQAPPSCANFDLIVRSPGVPRDLPVLHEAHMRGIPVWSEIELGAAVCPCPITAITGTNGKSTTTVLIGDLIRAAGRTALVAGNIGHPFTSSASLMQADDVAVIEVSAAQLENCHAFAPRTAVLTNVRREHMDVYTWEQYVAAKTRIVRNHTPDHATIANLDDPVCRQIAESSLGRAIFFSTRGPLPAGREGVFLERGQVAAIYDGDQVTVCSRRELQVPGSLTNIMAMMAVGLREGVPVEAIRDVATSYPGREHVIEHVATAAGVDYYNDSKATNPWSTLHALDAFPDQPIVLITGGKDDKEADVTPLAATLTGRVRHLITLGQTGPRTVAAARAHGMTAITETTSLAEAIREAVKVAEPGDVVLFSPGANSKDMFPDHRTRGSLFKQQVRLLCGARSSTLLPAR